MSSLFLFFVALLFACLPRFVLLFFFLSLILSCHLVCTHTNKQTNTQTNKRLTHIQRIAVTGFAGEVRDYLKDAVAIIGAQYTGQLTRDNTLLIFEKVL